MRQPQDSMAGSDSRERGERGDAGGGALAQVPGRGDERARLRDGTRPGHTSGETVGLIVFNPTSATATIAAEARGTVPIGYSLGIGSQIPLYAGAAGKAILAHCPPEIVQSQSLDPVTPRSPRAMEQLEKDLQLIRDTGWAHAEGERVPDAVGLAAPFFADGAVAGSLTFTIPRFRIDSVDVPALTTMLTLAARQITGLLSI